MDSRFCFIQATSRWMRRGFTATIALAASLLIAVPATAGTTLYEDSRFNVNLQAFVSNFSIWVDGAGGDASAVDGAGSSTVAEFYLEPLVDLTWNTGGGEIYSRLSWTFSSTHGEYDNTRSTTDADGDGNFECDGCGLGWYYGLANGADRTTSRREWLNLGYRNDLFDLSVGAQDVFIGRGLIIGDGYSNSGKYGGYFFGLNKTFHNTALVRLNKIGDTGFRSDIFWLDAQGSREAGPGTGQEAEAGGINVEYDASRLAGLSAGTFGAMYVDVLRVSGNAIGVDDREYYDFRADGIVFDSLPNWKFSGEIALQEGDTSAAGLRAAGDFDPADPTNTHTPAQIAAGAATPGDLTDDVSRSGCNISLNATCDYDAYVWYAAADYTFTDIPWTPTVGYRYYEASGDDNGSDDKIEQHESLFYTGSAGWETWFQGQIWGEFVSVQQNQRTHLVRGRIFPADTYSFSAHYVRNEADVGGTGYSSGDSYLDEINLFAEYYRGSFYAALILSYGWIGDEAAFAAGSGFPTYDGDPLNTDDNPKSAFIWVQHTF